MPGSKKVTGKDAARNAGKLRANPRIAWFKVHVVNQESIHNHSAFAIIEQCL